MKKASKAPVFLFIFLILQVLISYLSEKHILPEVDLTSLLFAIICFEAISEYMRYQKDLVMRKPKNKFEAWLLNNWFSRKMGYDPFMTLIFLLLCVTLAFKGFPNASLPEGVMYLFMVVSITMFSALAVLIITAIIKNLKEIFCGPATSEESMYDFVDGKLVINPKFKKVKPRCTDDENVLNED